MRGGRTKVSQYVRFTGLSGLSRAQNLLVGGKESIITVSGTVYKVHEFNATGTLEVAPFATLRNVEALVIAGGGGAGNFPCTGGGGAGGYRSFVVGENSGGGSSAGSPVTFASGSTYTVVVGAGGAVGSSGVDSSLVVPVGTSSGSSGTTVSSGSGSTI